MDMGLCVLALVVAAMGFVSSYVLFGGETVQIAHAARKMRALGQHGGGRTGGKLRRRADERARSVRICKEMPAFLDIVTLGLSAGISFDSSLELYCKRYRTELSSRLWDSMLLWRMGIQSRAEALDCMAAELKVNALQRFASTVNEALAFGTPLSATLERQAQVIRDEQRAMVEEEIERVPVKMLIPLGTLIVPAMLLAILGPLLGPAIGMA